MKKEVNAKVYRTEKSFGTVSTTCLEGRFTPNGKFLNFLYDIGLLKAKAGVKMTSFVLDASGSNSATAITEWRENWGEAIGHDTAAAFYIRGRKINVFSFPYGYTGGTFKLMDALFEVNKKGSMEANAEKAFARISALFTGRSVIGTGVDLPRTMISQVMDNLKPLHDGWMLLRHSYANRVASDNVSKWAVIVGFRYLYAGIGVAKGNALVLPDELMPEGIDLVIPSPSLTDQVLPKVSYIHGIRVAHLGTIVTDPQMLIHVSSMADVFAELTSAAVSRAKASLKGNIDEIFEHSLNNITDGNTEDDSVKIEDVETSASIRQIFKDRGKEALGFKTLVDQLIKEAMGSTTKKSLEAGNAPMTSNQGGLFYVLPDMSGLDSKTGTINPAKSLLKKGEARVDMDNGVIYINVHDAAEWLATWSGADYDDQLAVVASGNRFMAVRRPIGHSGQIVYGTLLDWPHTDPISERILDNKVQYKLSKEFMDAGQNWLKQFRINPTQTPIKGTGWRELAVYIYQLPYAHYSVVVGGWAKLSSKIGIFLREADRWLKSGKIDDMIPVYAKPWIEDPNRRIARKNLADAPKVPVSKYIPGTGPINVDETLEYVLRELINNKGLLPICSAVLQMDEDIIDHCNGKKKIKDGMLDITKAWNKAKDKLGYTIKQLAPHFGWISGDVRVRVDKIDAPFEGIPFLKEGVFDRSTKPITCVFPNTFEYNMNYHNVVTEQVAGYRKYFEDKAPRVHIGVVLNKYLEELASMDNANLEWSVVALYQYIYQERAIRMEEPRVLGWVKPYYSANQQAFLDCWLMKWYKGRKAVYPATADGELVRAMGANLVVEMGRTQARSIAYNLTKDMQIPVVTYPVPDTAKAWAKRFAIDYAIAVLKDERYLPRTLKADESLENQVVRGYKLIQDAGIDADKFAEEHYISDSIVWLRDIAGVVLRILKNFGSVPPTPIKPTTSEVEENIQVTNDEEDWMTFNDSDWDNLPTPDCEDIQDYDFTMPSEEE